MIDGAAVISGAGTLTASASFIRKGSATLSGSGSLTAFGDTLSGAAALLGEGTLICETVMIAAGAASLSGAGSCQAEGQVAWNTQHIQAISVDYSDREIYNDIRTECDIAAILIVSPETTPEFMSPHTISQTIVIPPNTTETFILEARADEVGVYFLDVWVENISIAPLSGYTESTCEAIEAGTQYQGEWISPLCYVTPRPSRIFHYNTTYATDRSMAWADVKNNYGTSGHPAFSVAVTMSASYVALDPDQRYIKIYASDDASIAKYGRRTMDLVWPLGQTPTDMQGIIDRYLERHSEPVPFVQITVLGKNDLFQARITEAEVNDRLWLPCPPMDMDEEFWLNNLACQHDARQGILEATFDLEEVRDMERT